MFPTRHNRISRIFNEENLKFGTIVTTSSAGIVGSTTGAVLGSFIPIPMVGTLFGGIIGGFVGGMFGGFSGVFISSEINHALAKNVRFGTGPYYQLNSKIIKKLHPKTGEYALFAEKFISNGELIWDDIHKMDPYDPRVILTTTDLENWSSEVDVNEFKKYCHCIDQDSFVGPNFKEGAKLDDCASWFMGHSCDPNVGWSGPRLKALKDIQPGEEVCYDYVTSECAGWQMFDHCDCGSFKCRGKLEPGDFMKEEIQAKYKGHFHPYIEKLVDEFDRMMKAMKASFDQMGSLTTENEDMVETDVSIQDVDPEVYTGPLTTATDEQKDDAKYCLEILSKDPHAWPYIGEKLKSDHDFIKDALKQDEKVAKYFEETIHNDTKFVKELVMDQPALLEYFHEVNEDPEVIEKILTSETWSFRWVGFTFRGNKDEMRRVIETYGPYFFEFCSSELHKDIEFVREVITKNGSAYQFIDDSLQSDKDLCLLALKTYGRAYQYASQELRDDDEVIRAALKTDGGTIEYMPYEIKNNYEYALMAVTSRADAYRELPDDLKSNYEICAAAATQWGGILEDFPEEMKRDRKLLLIALATDATVLQYAEDDVKEDSEVWWLLAKANPWQYDLLPASAKANKEITIYCMSFDGLQLQHAPEELRDDIEVVTEAIKSCPQSLQYASDSLKDNFELVKLAVMGEPECLEYASERLRDDEEIKNLL